MTPTADQSNRPFPPRFRHLERWSAFTVVVLAGLVALRFAWGVHADHARRDFIAQAHARGEKVLISDWITPPIPDPRNAAFFLRKAAAAISKSDQIGTFKTPLTADELKALQQLAAQSGPVISNVRHARKLKQVNWGINFTSPAYMIPLPHLNDASVLATFEADLACYAHATGNDRQAIERVRDILFFGRCVDQLPFLVSHLVALGIDNIACNFLAPIIPQLEIGPPATSANAATRQQIEALMADLLDGSPLVESSAAAWQGEEMLMLDFPSDITPMLDADVNRALSFGSTDPLIPLLRPGVVLDCVRGARTYQTIERAARKPTYPQAIAALPAMPTWTVGSMSYWITRSPTLYMFPWPNPALATHYSTLAKMRRTATQLAIRLYTLDHGHAPPSLQALVPQYLPKVPSDPMSAGNQPIITFTTTHRSTAQAP